MQSKWLRVCSFMLTLALVFNMLPLQVWAQAPAAGGVPAQEETTEQREDITQSSEDAKIVEEVPTNRTEYTKEFIMSNGLFLASVYNLPVHYQEDGQWKEIDNTLKKQADGTYTNTAGVWEVRFPAHFGQTGAVTVTKDGYTLSFGLDGELHRSEPATDGQPEPETVETTAPATEPAAPEAQTTEAEAESAQEQTAPVQEDAREETQPRSEQAQTETTQIAEPATEETTQPETEPVTEPATEAVTEPETEPATEAATQPETEPETTQATVPATEEDPQIAKVRVDGKTQIFTVQPAKTAQIQIKELDLRQAKEEALYEQTVLEKVASRLEYADVYGTTDIRYDLRSNRVKESVILESYSATLGGYRYTLDPGDLIPKLQEDGSILFYDPAGKTVVMAMPAPFLVDDDHCQSFDVQVSLTEKDGRYTLTYLLPQAWLASEERTWPVILDPAIVANLSDSNIQDTTVISARPNEANYMRATLQIGYSAADGKSRIFLGFSSLPTLTSSDVVVGAVASLNKIGAGSGVVPATVHKVNSTWQVQTLCWNNMPTYSTTVEDYAMIQNAGRYYWEITDLVQSWYADRIPVCSSRHRTR